MEAEMRIGSYRAPIMARGLKEDSIIIVDIDGTLLPYVNEKFRHCYRCKCGHEFVPACLSKVYPVSCPRCGGTSFKRNEPSLHECLSIVRKIIRKNVSSYQGARICLRRLSKRYLIFYVTGRDRIFFKETEAWLISKHFPYSSPHKLFMRKSNDGEGPCRLKARLIESFNRGRNIKAIIDDDLSIMPIAEASAVQFIWAPVCWEKNSYYGKLLRSL